MIQANTKAFSNLVERFRLESSLRIPDVIRYIQTNDFEKQWLKTAVVSESLKIYPALKSVFIDFNGDKFIALIGSESISNYDINVVSKVDANAGLMTYLIAEGLVNWRPGFSDLDLYENIFFQHEDPTYEGHSLFDLISRLEEVSLFLIPENSILKEKDLFRTCCYFLSLNDQICVLNFSQELLAIFEDISLQGSDKISYQTILDSLTSSSYKHSFLEVYRLIERLFPINYLKDFHKQSRSSQDFFEFVKTLEKSTGWRPKEDEALKKLFTNASKSNTLEFEKFIKKSPKQYRNMTPENFVYKLRNSIVHYRGSKSSDSLHDHEWDILIQLSLLFIDHQYTINESLL